MTAAGAQRVVLFEWMDGGHFALYVRRFAESLAPLTRLTVAAPDTTCERLADLPVTLLPLGAPRPPIEGLPDPEVRAIVEAEIDRFERAIRDSAADQAVHLYTDRILRRLIGRPPLPAPTTICVFRPRIHYPWAFRTAMPAAEFARAAALEARVGRWRRRSDARGVLTLDEVAVARWSRRRGCPAHWLPEPPVGPVPARPAAPVWDCCLYGALAERKGIGLLARAMAVEPTGMRVVLAGSVDAGFEPALDRYAALMRSSGAEVELRGRPHDEAAGLEVLAASRCVAIPYRGHYGMSRVLVEAASVGTPVVADRRGLIGHLARRFDLGRVVDCEDPRALRDGIASLVAEGPSDDRRAALTSFVERYSRENFDRALRAALRL